MSDYDADSDTSHSLSVPRSVNRRPNWFFDDCQLHELPCLRFPEPEATCRSAQLPSIAVEDASPMDYAHHVKNQLRTSLENIESRCEDFLQFDHFVYYLLLPLSNTDLKLLLLDYIEKGNDDTLFDDKFQFANIHGGLFFAEEVMQLFCRVRKELEVCKGEIVCSGSTQVSACAVCCEHRFLSQRSCCGYAICAECLAAYVSSRILDIPDAVAMQCPNCPQHLSRKEVELRLKYSLFTQAGELYDRRMKEVLLSPDQYLCPHCSHCLPLYKKGLESKLKLRSDKYRQQCPNCGSLSCSRCRTNWHPSVSCKENRIGDRLVKKWAEGDAQSSQQRNATKCPGCTRWYQKIDGCDHMSCNKCSTEFCYACGGRYRSFKFLGSHNSKLSVLGCKMNFLREHPVLRKTVRGSLFTGGVLITPVVVPLAVVVGGGALVVIGGAKAVSKVYRAVV